MTSTALSDLPFVVVRVGLPTNLWRVDASGDYVADCATGASHADALLEHMDLNENPSLLAMVAREAARADWTGVQVGFFQRLAEKAVSGR